MKTNQYNETKNMKNTTTEFERKWPLSVSEAKEQGLIETFYHDREKVMMWRVGIDRKYFNTGGKALDYYYEVVKPRDDANEQLQKDDAYRILAAKVLAGTTDWIAATDPDYEYAYVLRPGEDNAEKMQLRAFRRMIMNDDLPIIWVSLPKLENLIAELKNAKPEDDEANDFGPR